MFTLAELEDAARVVYTAMPPTPQYAWPLLAERAGAEVWVKHENHTPTGAFKVRGGFAYLDCLRRERPQVRGLVTATRGNHGQSLPYAARGSGVGVTVCVPYGNSVEKNAAMRALGAELVEHGADFDEAREHAACLAAARGLEMVPSFHPDLVRGVATYALELFRAVPDLDTVYVPIGMGSGICGLIRTRDLLGLSTRIVGVVAEGAPAYARSVAAGRVVTTAMANTLADGMACRVPDPVALAVIRAGSERIVQVSDVAVAAAMRAYWTDRHNLAEGAGAIRATLEDPGRRRRQTARVARFWGRRSCRLVGDQGRLPPVPAPGQLAQAEAGHIRAGDETGFDSGQVGKRPHGLLTLRRPGSQERRAHQRPVQAAAADQRLLPGLVLVNAPEHEGLNEPIIKPRPVPATLARTDAGDAHQSANPGFFHRRDQVSCADREQGQLLKRSRGRRAQRADDGFLAGDGALEAIGVEHVAHRLGDGRGEAGLGRVAHQGGDLVVLIQGLADDFPTGRAGRTDDEQVHALKVTFSFSVLTRSNLGG